MGRKLTSRTWDESVPASDMDCITAHPDGATSEVSCFGGRHSGLCRARNHLQTGMLFSYSSCVCTASRPFGIRGSDQGLIDRSGCAEGLTGSSGRAPGSGGVAGSRTATQPRGSKSWRSIIPLSGYGATWRWWLVVEKTEHSSCPALYLCPLQRQRRCCRQTVGPEGFRGSMGHGNLTHFSLVTG